MGKKVEEKKWMGMRKWMKDMRKVIGEEKRNKGIWLNLGNENKGLKMGKERGRILEEMMKGEEKFKEKKKY